MRVYLQVISTNKSGPDTVQSSNNPEPRKRRRSESETSEEPVQTKKAKIVKESSTQHDSATDFKTRLTALDSKEHSLQEMLDNTATSYSALAAAFNTSFILLKSAIDSLGKQQQKIQEYSNEVKELAELMKSMDTMSDDDDDDDDDYEEEEEDDDEEDDLEGDDQEEDDYEDEGEDEQEE